MGFADTLEQHGARPLVKGPSCSVRDTLDKMDAADAAALQAALDNPEVRHSVIVDALNAEGWRIGRDAVQRHRRDLCQCWKFRDGIR